MVLVNQVYYKFKKHFNIDWFIEENTIEWAKEL